MLNATTTTNPYDRTWQERVFALFDAQLLESEASS